VDPIHWTPKMTGSRPVGPHFSITMALVGVQRGMTTAITDRLRLQLSDTPWSSTFERSGSRFFASWKLGSHVSVGACEPFRPVPPASTGCRCGAVQVRNSLGLFSGFWFIFGVSASGPRGLGAATEATTGVLLRFSPN